jgi:hypothetical protein
MNLACTLGLHKWSEDCAKCARCGKTRSAMHHKLKGCTCSKCGREFHKIGEHGCWCAREGCNVRLHIWNGCKCSRCGSGRDEAHDWQGCKCSRCDAVREQGHDWQGCKCSRCGAIREQGHDWQGCKCSRCGAVREQGHDWNRNCERCSSCRAKRHGIHVWQNDVCSLCGTTSWRSNRTKISDQVQRALLDVIRMQLLDTEGDVMLFQLNQAFEMQMMFNRAAREDDGLRKRLYAEAVEKPLAARREKRMRDSLRSALAGITENWGAPTDAVLAIAEGLVPQENSWLLEPGE